MGNYLLETQYILRLVVKESGQHNTKLVQLENSIIAKGTLVKIFSVILSVQELVTH